MFDSLGDLTDLTLRGNNLTSLSSGVFDSLTELDRMNVRDNHLASQPSGVCGLLTMVTSLYLSGNGLTTLPSGLFVFSQSRKWCKDLEPNVDLERVPTVSSSIGMRNTGRNQPMWRRLDMCPWSGGIHLCSTSYRWAVTDPRAHARADARTRDRHHAPYHQAFYGPGHLLYDEDDDNDFVEVGRKTTVGVTASAYDKRPRESAGGVGCGESGCLPDLAHDGVGEEDAESRWSCVKEIVPDGGQCEITFTLDSPQDIADVQIKINGDKVGEYESYPGATVSSFGTQEDGVHTVTIESVGIDEDDWISLPEVRIMVDP
eukprot:g15990.t2